jgi:hypothetical protein
MDSIDDDSRDRLRITALTRKAEEVRHILHLRGFALVTTFAVWCAVFLRPELAHGMP